MMRRQRHSEDSTRYADLLASTRDTAGVCHRDDAVKLLVEELLADEERAFEYATSRANEVADGFDRTHQPETDHGQMTLDIDTHLVIGDSERVRVDHAMHEHTRAWLDIQTANQARVAAAWAAKDQHGLKLLAIQEERTCSMWEAEQILRGLS
jgi:hypothetical protein